MKIVISGTPGTGKNKVAKLLAKRLKWKLIDLSKFAEEKGFYSGWDKRRKCWIVNTRAVEKEVKKLKENLVMQAHWAHVLPVDVVIILRTAPKELRKRLRKRGWLAAKIKENVEAEIMEVCKIEALEAGKRVYEIDTTGKKPESAVKEILSKLAGKI